MIDNNKSEQKPWKVLAKEYIFGKFQTLSLQLCQKNEPHYWYFSDNLATSKEPCFKADLKWKVTILKLNGYYVTQSIFFFIFSRCSLSFDMKDGKSFTKRRRIVRLNRLLSSTNDNRIHGTYRVKTQSGKCSAWYMKITWKLQYQFTNAQINWLME